MRKKDMPNFFVEALTVSGGNVYTQVRQIIVPPEKRVLNVEVVAAAKRYKPGARARVQLKLTDFLGKPFVGSTVVTVYDKALEYISGGSNVRDIKEFFWKWKRHHTPRTEDNVNRHFGNIVPLKKDGMSPIGIFGHSLADDSDRMAKAGKGRGAVEQLARRRSSNRSLGYGAPGAAMSAMKAAAPMMAMEKGKGVAMDAVAASDRDGAPLEAGGGVAAPTGEVQATVRSRFADLVFWTAALETDKNGLANVDLDMPENLTTWKIKAWGMGHGTKVGEGETEVITSKDLVIRLQAPRFFVEKDEVVLSAVVHNYLDGAKNVRAVLELGGDTLEAMDKRGLSQRVRLKPNGEERVDWRVRVLKEGTATVTMKALTDEESDAMQMSYPVYVHGMLKTESWSGAIRPKDSVSSVTINVPRERRPEQTRLEVRYSPSIALAMVDALPYLVEYPYRNTESVISRFVPTVLTQRIMQKLGVDLESVKKRRANLNPQEIGDAAKRAEQWKRYDANPVFDTAKVNRLVKEALKDITAMQNGDGGWGWFYSYQQHSYAHTTAYVVHGLQVAKQNDVALVPGVLERGVQWMKRYQEGEVRKLKNAPTETRPWKTYADNLDAFVYMVLVDAGEINSDMMSFLYRDRNHLAVYAKAMFGLALDTQGQAQKRDMLLRNVEQYLEQDAENQTAWLKLPNNRYWWHWYGSEYEAHAYFLKLLVRVKPQSDVASGMAKYLINNRKHSTYWHSTRDTAVCLEAIADYVRATGEDQPDMTVEVLFDGRKYKEVRITKDNLFDYDNVLILKGDAVGTGEHKITLRKKGAGPLYFNAYLTNFTLEEFIQHAGLEIKVNRQYFKLIKKDKSIRVVGSRGQALDQKVEKYERVPMKSGDTVKSGELVEIELTLESKNDYEYLMFEDMKPAGFEPVDVRSGHHGQGLGAYMELRDERVAFFLRRLARGKSSLSYRMRAEIPGKFSALPTRGNGVYAPELRANSDEIKLNVVD